MKEETLPFELTIIVTTESDSKKAENIMYLILKVLQKLGTDFGEKMNIVEKTMK